MGGEGGYIRDCVAKMWHRLKEGERLGRGIRNEREAEKKPSSQKQLSMTVRGQNDRGGRRPRTGALTGHELDVQFMAQQEFNKHRL